MFLGRNSELNFLWQRYQATGSQVSVVYGQRFVGRHALLKEFTKTLPCKTLIARAVSDREICFQWAKENKVGNSLGQYPSFQELFSHLVSLDDGDKLVIVIDEFQNILRQDRSFMKAILDIIAMPDKGRDVFFILSSSSICFVENGLIDKIGDYAFKISGFLKVKELRYEQMRRFMPSYTRKETMEMYSVLGGYPGLWMNLDPYKTVKENIIDIILNPNGFFMHEAQYLVESQLREVQVYNTILLALASGKNKLNDLYYHTDFSRAKLSVYIKNLMELELVQKAFSVDSDSRGNTQKGVYRIQNPLVLFYYAFVFPNLNGYYSLNAEDFYDTYIRTQFREYVEDSMKVIGQEIIRSYCEKGMIPFEIDKMGEWVGKLDSIDVVAFNENKEALVCMCNYEKNVLTIDDYDWLMLLAKKARFQVHTVVLVTFERFDQGLLDKGKQMGNLHLISLKDL